MFSSKNVAEKVKADTKQVPHYGLRKLSVGVVSVLLGTTTLCLGSANTVAHADDASANNNNEPEEYTQASVNMHEVDVTDQAASNAGSAVASSSALSNASSTANSSSSNTGAASSENGNTDQAMSSAVQAQSVQESASTLQREEADAGSIIDDQSHNYTDYQNGTAQGVTLSDGSTLTVTNDLLNKNNPSSTLTFKSSAFKAGDTYTILIPKPFMEVAGDVAELQPSFGTTKIDEVVDTNGHRFWRITDKFISTGSISQNIILSRSSNSISLDKYFANTDTKSYWRPFDLIKADIKVIKNDEVKKLGIGYQLNSIVDSTFKPLFVMNNGNFDAPFLNGSDLALGLTWKDILGCDNISLSANVYGDLFGDVNSILKNARLTFDVPDYVTVTDSVGTLSDHSHHKVGTLKVAKVGNQIVVSDFVYDNGTSPEVLNTSTPILSAGTYLNFKIHVSVPDDQFNSDGLCKFDLANGKLVLNPANPDVSYTGNVAPQRIIILHRISDFKGDVFEYGSEKNHQDLGTGDYYLGNGKYYRKYNVKTYLDYNGASYDYGFNLHPIKNASNFVLHDIHYSLIIPDGFLIYDFLKDFANLDSNATKITLTLKDGTIVTLTPDQLKYYKGVAVNDKSSLNDGYSNRLVVAHDTSIAKIDIDYDHLDPNDYMGMTYPYNISYQVADKYVTGQPVQIGDLLFFKSHVWSNDSRNLMNLEDLPMCDLLITDPNNDIKGVFTLINNLQMSKVPGQTNAGSMGYKAAESEAYGHPHLQHPVAYLMVPQNASLNDLSKIEVYESLSRESHKLTPKSISVITVDGIKFIKLDLSNYNELRDGFAAYVRYGNEPDMQSGREYASMLVVSDNFDQNLNGVEHFTHDTDDTIGQAVKDLIKKENINVDKTTYQDSRMGYWDINTSNGIGSATMADSNMTAGLSTNVSQDVHGTDADHFNLYGSIINATPGAMNNAVQVVNLPDVSDGHSQFTPELTGPATLVDPNDANHNLSNLATIVYRDSSCDLNTIGNTFSLSGWKTADEITDWSKVKSIAVYFNKGQVPKMTTARLVMPMIDKKIYDHVDKSIYLGSSAWSKNADGSYQLRPVVIAPGTEASAKLTVQGKSTVSTWIHYKDEAGVDKYVELTDKAKTYNEGVDTMNRNDFMQSDSDLTAFDKTLLPTGLAINWRQAPKIANSNIEYLDGYSNGLAAFGQTVVPYFDGDKVVFEAELPEQVSVQKIVHRTIHYVFENGDKAADDKVQSSKTFTRTGLKNPFTQEITWNKDTSSDLLDSVGSPQIDGFTPDKGQIDEVTVTPADNDIVVTVTYKANDQYARVSYYDDTEGKLLTADDLTGKTGQTSTYKTASKIDGYTSQGYTLVSDNYPAAGLVFDSVDGNVQKFEVHFKHGTKTENGQQVVHRTIKYVYANGNQAANTVNDDLTFNNVKTYDAVTDDLISDNWTPEQDFTTVNSPSIKGYTPDRASVSNKGITHETSDIVEVVTYNADGQKAVVKYIDDTEHKQLDIVDLTGLTDADSGYNTKSKIAEYESQHYVKFSDSTKGQNIVFDDDASTDQVYEVHFVHDTQDITDTRTIKEVVHYVYGADEPRSGKAADDYHGKDVEFIRGGYQDLVTGQETWDDNWITENDTFIAVTSPTIQGYTPDRSKVAAVTVTPESSNIERTVVYRADNQKLTVNFVDDNTGETLKSVDKTGKSDTNVGYNTKSDIDCFVKQKHYKLNKDETGGADLVFDHDTNTDQVYTVHLGHQMQKVQDSKTFTEVIHYVYEDGSQAAENWSSDNLSHDDKFWKALNENITRNGSKDLVTNEVTWDSWTPFYLVTPTVTSPTIKGYYPDKFTVNGGYIEVATAPRLIEFTVTYHPENQKMTINYIDDTTGQTLETKSLTGKTNADSGYNTKLTIDKYLAKHYQLVSDDTKGQSLKFDDDVKTDQVYNVHLSHTIEALTPESSIINETIKYQYEDGSKAADTYQATPIEFTRTGSHDLVTDVKTWNAWTPASYSFDVVVSPEIAGYTPNVSQVNAITVYPNGHDIVETVVYVPNIQYMVVNYIDQTTGKTLKTDSLSGASDSDSNYTTKANIKKYVGQHYLFVSDETNGGTLTFDNDDQNTQTYNVYFKHATKPASQTKTIHEVVHYVYADGKTAAEDYVAEPIVLTQTGTNDLVTGNTTWNDDWTTGQSFVAIKSPKLEGYTPSFSEIDEVPVNEHSSDVERTVVYTANAQKAGIKYIDDTTGQVLEVDKANGKFGQKIAFSNDVATEILMYTFRGYDLVSNDFNGQSYVANDSQNQFEVHFKHKMTDVTRHADVKQTIHYWFEDGTKAQNDNVQSVHFDEHGVYDAVTKQTIWTPSDPQTFAKVMTPAMEGYTYVPFVDAVTVKFGSEDETIDIIYHANNQLAGIKYIDDTEGRVLHQDRANGQFAQKISFANDPQTMIDQYIAQGYKFVKSTYDGQAYQADNSKNQFEVHFAHQLDPVQDSKVVTRTIHYQYDDGTLAKPDVVQTVTFNRNGQYDKVAKQTAWDPWTKDQSFAAVISPVIDGYTANILKVDGIAVTPESGDSEVTVIYTKNQAPEDHDHTDQPGETPNDTDTNNVSDTPTSAIDESSSLNKITEVGENSQVVTQTVKTNNAQAKNQLPQTGDEHDKVGLIGIITAGLAGMLGLAGKRRKKHEE